jgi:glycine oxidase
MYPGLSAALREETGLDNGYHVCGGVELPQEGQKPSDLPTEEWHGEGAVAEALSGWLIPEVTGGFVGPARFAAHLPGMAQVRNPWHLRALEAACRARGVQLLAEWPVRRIVREGERVVGVDGDQGRLVAGQYLVSGGAWTGQLLEEVGVALPVRPVRGQMVLLRMPAGRRPIVLQGARYIVPREDGMVLVGSTMEDVGFDTTTTEEAITGLLEFARGVNPRLGEAPVEKAWAGLRPASADGKPYLGAVPGFANLHVAAGHFRSGILLSPITGVVMMQHLTGRETAVPLGPFAVGR